MLAKDKTKPSVLDVQTFRRDFERLLTETDPRALVVLIDDLDRLDRCMPGLDPGFDGHLTLPG